MSLITRVHDLSGVLVLDLTAANGYSRVPPWSLPGLTWRRIVVTSPVVDGEFETQRAKGAGRISGVLRVEGATWQVVEQRVAAVEAALSEHHLFVFGAADVTYTFRARPADIDASFTPEDILLKRRLVSVEIPVQPNPVVTGL